MELTVAAGSTAAARRSVWSVWAQALRVRSLTISAISVLAGGAIAFHAGDADLWRVALALCCAVAAQAGTNLTNVHYNYKARGRSATLHRADPRGSTVVIEQGLLTSRQVWNGALVAFTIAIASGLTVTWLVGWPLLVLGVFGVLFGYSYAGPPLRLAYWGMGVPTVFLFMGPVMVIGTAYAASGDVMAGAIAASLPIALFAAGILHINDLRDFDEDLAHRKRTLSTLAGRRAGALALVAGYASAYAIVIGAVAVGVLPAAALVTLLTMVLAVPLARTVLAETAPDRLHAAWTQGVKLHMAFGALLIAALVIAAPY